MNIKNKQCICFIFDKQYINQGRHAIESCKNHNPSHTTILLIDDTSACDLADIQLSPEDIGLNKDYWLIVGRIAIVEYALLNLGFDTAIFVDGDTYTYHNYDSLQSIAENHALVVIPHITQPLPNDNKFPQNRVISLSGNYNTGVWAASKEGLNFIRWWREQTSLFPITRPDAGLVNEQGWLRFAGDFDDNVKIFRHPGYNVAYWNIKQRTLGIKNHKYYIDNEPLSIVHFSGLKKELDPSQMSVFQNRYYLEKTDLAYMLFNDYHKLVWKDSVL